MKTYQVNNHEPGTLTIKNVATVEADYFEVGPNGDLLFFDTLQGSPYSTDITDIPHCAFASGRWSRVVEVEEDK